MSTMKDKKVLVVDDEPTLLEILIEEFQLQDAEVKSAANGALAIDLLKTWEPDVIVSDLHMHGGDGPLILNYLKARSQSMRPIFILLSGSAELSASDASARGIDASVAKPFAFTSLLAITQNLLKQRSEKIRVGA